ncbi:hypothetical protein JBL43_11595 [Aureibaculum sp. A20]|uniref:DUF3971 domain-containing protein n=1 Tax=Aureibaculum flavum TaxID=2795986 RepID=A0ABS0WSC1_9FLAO|nr:hypothetical protein [Aureibaculum flavum]MBJ2174884.1 hypothetical protein [Aureibaculum flavum]
MRKKGLYFFIVFVIVLVVLYVWRYKRAQVFENRVPANATKVINVNLRQIENHLLFDFLTNPITYLKSRKKKDSIKKPRTALTKGVSVPKNILFYTNPTDLSNNWFSSIVAINDTEELFKFLLKEGFKKIENNGIVYFSKANFVLSVKGEQFIIALKTSPKVDVSTTILTLFSEDDYLSEDAIILKPIVNNTNDISFSLGDDELNANFKDGFFELEGSLKSDLFLVNENPASDEDGVISMSGELNRNNAVFKQFLTDKKDKFNAFTHLSLDSIVNKWNGKFHMNITSIEQKTDTIVSYEYDDDFNKVEIKSTQDKRIPSLYANLGQQSVSSLTDYFYGKNAIQIIENDTVFTTIPVFKVLTTNVEDKFEIRVNKNKKSENTSATSSKFNFYFNTEKYMETPLDIPLTKDQQKFLQLVKSTKLEWTANDQFLLKINLKDVNRNFLGKLLKQ